MGSWINLVLDFLSCEYRYIFNHLVIFLSHSDRLADLEARFEKETNSIDVKDRRVLHRNGRIYPYLKEVLLEEFKTRVRKRKMLRAFGRLYLMAAEMEIFGVKSMIAKPPTRPQPRRITMEKSKEI